MLDDAAETIGRNFDARLTRNVVMIGELGRAYGLSVAAFIGGSLAPTGGHNPLEPAVWGVLVPSPDLQSPQ